MMLNPGARRRKHRQNPEDAIVRREIGLIILDPFVKTHSVPENLNNEMDSVAQLLSDSGKHNVAVIFPTTYRKAPPVPAMPTAGAARPRPLTPDGWSTRSAP
jgi:hypothetical protein